MKKVNRQDAYLTLDTVTRQDCRLKSKKHRR